MAEAGRSSSRGRAAGIPPAGGLRLAEAASASPMSPVLPDLLSPEDLAAKFGRFSRRVPCWARRGRLVSIRIVGGAFSCAGDVRRPRPGRPEPAEAPLRRGSASVHEVSRSTVTRRNTRPSAFRSDGLAGPMPGSRGHAAWRVGSARVVVPLVDHLTSGRLWAWVHDQRSP
jgi:hypothetical protein